MRYQNYGGGLCGFDAENLPRRVDGALKTPAGARVPDHAPGYDAPGRENTRPATEKEQSHGEKGLGGNEAGQKIGPEAV